MNMIRLKMFIYIFFTMLAIFFTSFFYFSLQTDLIRSKKLIIYTYDSTD